MRRVYKKVDGDQRKQIAYLKHKEQYVLALDI